MIKTITVKATSFGQEDSYVVSFEHEPAQAETPHCPGIPEQVNILAVRLDQLLVLETPDIITLLTDQELDILEIAIRRELAAGWDASSEPFINPGHKENP